MTAPMLSVKAATAGSTLSHPGAQAEPEAPLEGLLRVFGSKQFFKLWLGMVNSAMGDWLGFFAIAVLARRVGGTSATGAVFAARIAPGMFFATLAGVVVDRWNRRYVMVICDIGRALVLLALPFVDSAAGLVIASLVLEMFTLAWQPAKEASVPNLVPASHLTTANSLSVIAAYGTFPLAAGAFALLAKAAESLGGSGYVPSLRLNQEGLAFYVDALTFLISAAIIWSLVLPRRAKGSEKMTPVAASSLLKDLKEGWRFVMTDPVVRAVNVGLATGLIGGGMLVPLGPDFIRTVLGAGSAGYGLFLFVLGVGMAVGVITISITQQHLPKTRVFSGVVLGSGLCLFGATSTTSLTPAAILIGGLGFCAGTAYVLGFTLLHESVTDELRGRIFATLNTLVRMCLLVAFAVAPFLTTFLDGLAGRLDERKISVLGLEIFVPGIRLTLWLAASIMVLAGLLSARSLRGWRQIRGDVAPSSPSVQ